MSKIEATFQSLAQRSKKQAHNEENWVKTKHNATARKLLADNGKHEAEIRLHALHDKLLADVKKLDEEKKKEMDAIDVKFAPQLKKIEDEHLAKLGDVERATKKKIQDVAASANLRFDEPDFFEEARKNFESQARTQKQALQKVMFFNFLLEQSNSNL